MKVYIDGILFLNFAFDFLLLLTTSVILKRNSKPLKLILSAFVGSLSTLLLFFKINQLELFILKIILSAIMCIIAFGNKGKKYILINIITLYLSGIILGGFLYSLNIEFSYKHKGLIFYHHTPSINLIFLLIVSPIILYIYTYQARLQRKKVKSYHKVNIKIGNKTLNLNGYLDTGNTLTHKGKPVIITNKKNTFKKKKILIPYTAIGVCGLLECIEVKVNIPDLGNYDCLLGFEENLNIDGIDVLLNNKMEETNDRKNKKNI